MKKIIKISLLMILFLFPVFVFSKVQTDGSSNQISLLVQSQCRGPDNNQRSEYVITSEIVDESSIQLRLWMKNDEVVGLSNKMGEYIIVYYQDQ